MSWQEVRLTLGTGAVQIFAYRMRFTSFLFQLPATASYKMLNEKCNEFGDVQRLEDKGNGSVLIVYSNEWEAEGAISIL